MIDATARPPSHIPEGQTLQSKLQARPRVAPAMRVVLDILVTEWAAMSSYGLRK